MSDAIIKGTTFKAPDATTHFKLVNYDHHQRAAVTKEVEGKEVYIGHVDLRSSVPEQEQIKKVVTLLTSHGFKPERGPQLAAA